MSTTMTGKRVLLLLAGLFVLAQAVRPARTNPPIDPAKTLVATGHVPPHVDAIFERACRDCHSSRTTWPWYSNVAPTSWLLADHVNDGRRELSFSIWGNYTPQRAAKTLKEICEQVRKGEMPLGIYVLLHPDSKLGDADRQAICEWTEAERTRLGAVPADDEKGERR